MWRGTRNLDAAWFDMSAVQPDGFGRPLAPDVSSPRRYVGWRERAVNATLSCNTPGCVASGSLQLFSGSSERARFCRMNLYVEHHSGSLPWITVNGANVSFECAPPASPCEANASRSMYPCVFGLDLAKLVTQAGTLEVAAKLSEAADGACTYKGAALRAVPMVTCLVGDLGWPGTSTDVVNAERPELPSAAGNATETASEGEAELADEELIGPGTAANGTQDEASEEAAVLKHGRHTAASAAADRLAANASRAASEAAARGLAVEEPSGLAAESVAAAAVASANASGAEALGEALRVNATVAARTTPPPKVEAQNATAWEGRSVRSTTAPPPEPWVLGSGSTAGEAAREALGLPANATEVEIATTPAP
eukprot:SRR837773.3998.p1 GENE.SRR837773.3998~~SRR837773.3998.p1  ORF type:complete len:400 (+),score=92.15 SRR837773.3998:94-1200(+)